MLEYQPMTIEERKTCALLAAEAFYDYDYFSICVPDEKRRKKFLDGMIKCEFKPSDGEYIKAGWLSALLGGGR